MNEETQTENMENTKTAAPPENAPETAQCAVKYRLIGDVQNVGFRNYLANTAEELRVRGWAKNESDGGLVVLLCGEKSAVSQMLPHLQQGPVGAAVGNITELVVEEEDAAPDDFQVL